MDNYSIRKKRTEEFLKDRLGMFIHWGLYAIPARGEWVRSIEKISNEEYQKYFDEFDPIDYNPREWAKLAKKAGMKYAVLTTKHHDGFCLFDSKYTDYKATNTKANRDLIKEYADAFRAEGLKVGFYYSLLDWHHPDYPHYGDRIHPMRDNEEFKDVKHNFENYVEYLHNQVRELLTNYGEIDIMWFDFSYDDMKGEKWEATKLVNMIRELQPQIIIDNRLITHLDNKDDIDEMPAYAGDFESPEQVMPTEDFIDNKGRCIPWEACFTLNENWGYCAKDKNFKSAKTVIRALVECVSKNGNLLINVGPDAKGKIPKETVDILEQLGSWMKQNRESIYGCVKADFEKPDWGRYTQNGKKLYAHIFDRGIAARFRLNGLLDKTKSVRFLADGSELNFSEKSLVEKYPNDLFVDLKVTDVPEEADMVLEIELK